MVYTRTWSYGTAINEAVTAVTTNSAGIVMDVMDATDVVACAAFKLHRRVCASGVLADGTCTMVKSTCTAM